MSYLRNASGAVFGPAVAAPPAGALLGVRTRRVYAFIIDVFVMSAIFIGCFIALGVLGIATFGLTWLLLPPLYPIVALLYNGLSISGWAMATPGMRVCDLEMRLMDGTRVPFVYAAAHAFLFYLSMTLLTPIVLLVSLFTADKRCLHDALAGVVVTRRIV